MSQQVLMQGKKPTSAELVKRKDGSYLLQIQVKNDPPSQSKTDSVLGVDLGRNAGIVIGLAMLVLMELR